MNDEYILVRQQMEDWSAKLSERNTILVLDNLAVLGRAHGIGLENNGTNKVNNETG